MPAATACWRSSARSRRGRTIPSARCAPASRRLPRGGSKAVLGAAPARPTTAFGVRVGVHTGGVLLGGGVDAKENIRGQAKSTSRHPDGAGTAPPERLAHQPRYVPARARRVHGRAPAAPRAEGMDEPIVTYLVQGAKPGRAFRVATRGIEGVETPDDRGRDAEDRATAAGLPPMRVRRRHAGRRHRGRGGRDGQEPPPLRVPELGRDAPRSGSKLCQGRADPQTQTQPLRFAVARRADGDVRQIADTDSMERLRSKNRAGVSRTCSRHDDGAEMARAHAHVLGQLDRPRLRGEPPHIIGIKDDAGQTRSRGFHAAAQMFRRMSPADGSARPAARSALNTSGQRERERGSPAIPVVLLLERPALGRRRVARLPPLPCAGQPRACRRWCSVSRVPRLSDRRADWSGAGRDRAHRARSAR